MMINHVINQSEVSTWPSSNNLDDSSSLHQFNFTNFSSTNSDSGLITINSTNARSYEWIVPMLVVYLLSYILQVGFLGRGVHICYQVNAGWVFRKNQRGFILPNTRFVISLCHIVFASIQFVDTIFLVMGAVGPTLFTERYRISGFVWYTLWLSGWTLSWGIAACCFMIAYKQGGFISRMVSKPVTSTFFNAFFISGAILITITHIATFALIVTKQLAMASEIQARMSQLPVDFVPDVESIARDYNSAIKLQLITDKFRRNVSWIFYLRLGWSIVLLMLLVPLGTILIKMLQQVNSTKENERSRSSFQAIAGELRRRQDSKHNAPTSSPGEILSSSDPCIIGDSSNKSVDLGSQKSGIITNVSLVFLHILIYVIVLIGFAPALHSAQQALQDKAQEIKQLAYLSKGLYAIAGLWSSWIFLRLTRQMQAEKKTRMKTNTSTSTNQGSLPNNYFDQLSSYQFPVNPAVTRL